MCLIAFAWQMHPRYRLVLAANRDEAYARPTARAHWWPQNIFAGQDLQAGGAWCGVNFQGRLAAVTNVHEAGSQNHSLSRGQWVVSALETNLPLSQWAANTAAEKHQYRPFNGLLLDDQQLIFVSNRGQVQQLNLAPGVYAISNGHWDAHWPKTQHAKQQLAALIKQPQGLVDGLFDLLAPPETQCKNPPIQPDKTQIHTQIFVQSQRYGTRASTVIMQDNHGQTDFYERGYNPAAATQYTIHETWRSA